MDSTDLDVQRPATTDYRQFAIKVEDPTGLFDRLQRLQSAVAEFSTRPDATVEGQWVAGIRDALSDSIPAWVQPDHTPSPAELGAAVEEVIDNQASVMQRLQMRLDHATTQLHATGDAGWQAYGEGIAEVITELCPNWYDEYSPWDLPEDFIPTPDVRLESHHPETHNPASNLPAAHQGIGR